MMHLRLREALILLVSIVVLSACSSSSTPLDTARGNSSSGFALNVMDESLFDGAQVGGFDYEVLPGRNATVVQVSVRDAVGLKALYFQLSYDPARYTPLGATPTDALGSVDELLTLYLLPETGEVHFGQVIILPQKHEGFTGSAMLATVRFVPQGETATRLASTTRTASTPPDTDESKTTITWNPGTSTLSWGYYSQGDYDQNSEVNIADLTPLGIHLGITGPFLPTTAQSVVDGDSNSEINIADVTPIGSNFGNTVASYMVYASQNAGDYPATNLALPIVAQIAVVDFSQAIGTPANDRLQFNYQVLAPAAGDNFWVRPYDGAHCGSPSNMVTNGQAVTSLTLAIDPDSIMKPPSGTGTQADPYTFSFMDIYNFTLTHPVDGDVTSVLGADYFCTDGSGACNWQSQGEFFADAGATYDFYVYATYSGETSNSVFFHPQGGASLVLEVDPNSTNQPVGGSGSLADPFVVQVSTNYQMKLTHSGDGVVTTSLDTAYTTSDSVNTQVSDTGVLMVGATVPAGFSVHSTYLGQQSNFLYFTPPQVTFGLHSNTPAHGGTGTQADPYRVYQGQSYDLAVIDQASATDVTLQCVFTSTDNVNAPVTAGTVNVSATATTGFSIWATYQGNPAVPEALYFTPESGNQPPSASFAYTTGTTGQAPVDVGFDASASTDIDGTIVQYEWDFHGDHVYDYTTTNTTAEYSYTGPGTFNPWLKVTDNQGATGEYQAIQAVEVTSTGWWSTTSFSTQGLRGCSVRDIGGVPGIAICDDDSIDYYHGTNALGTSFTENADLDTEAAYRDFVDVQLSTYLGQPLIAYSCWSDDSTSNHVRCIVAQNATGSAWNTPKSVNAGTWWGCLDVHVPNNGINVYYIKNDEIALGRSTDGGGTFPTMHIVESMQPGGFLDVIYFDRPIIAYSINDGGNNAIWFKRAVDQEGTNWSPAPVVVSSAQSPQNVVLDVAYSCPVIAYVDIGTDTELYFVRAVDGAGSSWGTPELIETLDWSVSTHNIALAIISAKPALAYQHSDRVVYRRANDRAGTHWGQRVSVDASVTDSRNISLCEVGSNPCVVYNTTGDGGATSSGSMFCVLHN